MHIIIRWLVNALVLLGIAYVVPGFEVASLYSALIIVVILGLVNAVIRPILLLLTLPINILTLGLFTFVVNALMLWFVSSVVEGFAIAGFGAAFIGALILSFISWLLSDKYHS